MNYIAEIKAFHDLVQTKQLSSGQIALWYGLMYINNKCTWTEWFTAPNLTLELNTGLSRSGIAKARNVLKQHGILDFKQNGTKATSYKLFSSLAPKQESTQIETTMSNSKQVGNQIGVQDGNQSSKQDGAQVCTPLNKLNETKQKKKESKKETGGVNMPTGYQSIIDFFTSDPDLQEAIWGFIQMRINSKKKPTDKAVELLLKRLEGFSGNTSEQIEILNRSTMSNWSNIYPLKKEVSESKTDMEPTKYDYDAIQKRMQEKMWENKRQE